MKNPAFLNEHYIESEEDVPKFRFEYSGEYLRWALMPPGWQAYWHVGVRSGGSAGLTETSPNTKKDNQNHLCETISKHDVVSPCEYV